jgi:hypothetical protein
MIIPIWILITEKLPNSGNEVGGLGVKLGGRGHPNAGGLMGGLVQVHVDDRKVLYHSLLVVPFGLSEIPDQLELPDPSCRDNQVDPEQAHGGTIWDHLRTHHKNLLFPLYLEDGI